ncbi:hypothetical protein [Aliiroseovarius sp. S253]|uniref:hypothetical protein n=1 Tax=Aliiroseovarius sp. S253 TaxID=3415133 RepID=UPI003C7E1C33
MQPATDQISMGTPMKREIWTKSERELMVELCKYHSQTLLASRNKFDIDDQLPKVVLPTNGVVQAETVLLDHALSAHETAVSALLTCGFAFVPEHPSHACKLLISNDQFEISEDFAPPHVNYSHLGHSLSAMFRVYEQNGRLGHPSTMKRVFECFKGSALVEERFGFQEWTEKALDLAYPRRRSGIPSLKTLESDYLWVTDTFDWYLEEAKRQWS